MTIKRSDVTRLEEMGYFGDLSENIFQRFKNGVNGALASVGNAAAAGKLDVGQTIVGLEKEYKAWLGANRISNPTLADFKNYLSLLDQKYNLGLSNTSQAAQSSTTPASEPNAGQPSSATQPTAGGQPASAPQAVSTPINPVIQNTLDWFNESIQKNTSVSEQTAIAQVNACIKLATKTGTQDQTIQEFNKIVQANPGNEIAASIAKAIQQPNESKIVFGKYLREDDQDATKAFSMDQARAVFGQIAQQNYNNQQFGAGSGAPNPAGNSGGGAAAGNAAAGGNAPNNKNANRQEDSSRRMISVDFRTYHLQCNSIGVREDTRAKLREIITTTANESVASAGAKLENSKILESPTTAFQLLVALLRAVEE